MLDGSSIRGFTEIHESDMKLMPDVTTAYVDPFRDRKTLVMNFFVVDPLTGEPYSRDPQQIAKRAEEYLRSTGIADTVFLGAEAEFLHRLILGQLVREMHPRFETVALVQ